MNSLEPLPELPPREISRRRPGRPLVFIRHPGLDRILLALPAFSTGSTTAPYGVFCPLVLDACRVLTNHAGTSRGDFLALDIQGHNRIQIDDAPLTDECYYFLGPPEVEANTNYPIVRTFSAFTFPPVLPDRWARAAAVLQQQPRSRPIWFPSFQSEKLMSQRVWVRDEKCIITRYPDVARCTHIVPAAEEPWFIVNHMDVYTRTNCYSSAIDEPANGIMLRPDVQHCFDDCGFVFYPDAGTGPCGDSPDDGSKPFVTYFINDGFSYLPELFHRRRVALHPTVSVEFLYARFAYAIIGLPGMDLLYESVPEPPKIAVARENLRRWAQEQAEKRRAAGEELLSDGDTDSDREGGSDDEYPDWCTCGPHRPRGG